MAAAFSFTFALTLSLAFATFSEEAKNRSLVTRPVFLPLTGRREYLGERFADRRAQAGTRIPTRGRVERAIRAFGDVAKGSRRCWTIEDRIDEPGRRANSLVDACDECAPHWRDGTCSSDDRPFSRDQRAEA
jgi:hypothetical protein